MKTKLIGVGAALLALAGGVMFCGGEDELMPPDNDQVENAANDQEPAPRPAETMVRLQLARGGFSAPAFWAVRTGETWSRPSLSGIAIEFAVADDNAPYSVVAVCDETGEKGIRSIRTTVLEATARELPDPVLLCGAADDTETVQVSGAIRGVDGRVASLNVGSHSEIVPNPQRARDVLFGTRVPAGQQTFVAVVGGVEKTRVAVARNLAVEAEATTVELDLTNGQALTALSLPLATDGFTSSVGGTVALWFDGRTRVGVGPLAAWTDGEPMFSTRTSGEARDYVDVRASFKGQALPNVEYAPLAFARFITRADGSQPMILPMLSWVGPSQVSVSHDKVEFAWSSSNWAVFGNSATETAVFMPVALVGSVHTVSSVIHHLDAVVTPNRLPGKASVYHVPKLATIEGWNGQWTFPSGQAVEATSGNLTAFAGGSPVDPGLAIAAYLDGGNNVGPADLGANDSLTVVVAGSPVVMAQPDKSLADLVEARCFEQRPCAVKIKENALAVEHCPDLVAYNDCRAEGGHTADASDFVRDLRHQIIRWYNADVVIPNAVPLEQALSAISEDKVRRVEDRIPDAWYAYDPDVYQVFWHPDPTRENSATVWYGAYLAGRLVSIYPVNWNVSPAE